MIVHGSDLSAATMRHALAAAVVAHKLKQKLLLVHVLDPAWVGSNQPPGWDLEELAQQRLEREAARLREQLPELDVQVTVRHGSAHRELADAAGSDPGNLLVVSSSPQGTPVVRVGATAERLTLEASCPVLVLRDIAAFEAWHHEGRALRVVVGVDEGKSCEGAVALARRLRDAGCEVIAVRVYSAPEARERYGMRELTWLDKDPRIEELLVRDLEKRIDDIGGLGGARVMVELGMGRAGDHLVAVAEREQADLLLVGNHRRTGFERLSSVGAVALHFGDMAVLCVPPIESMGQARLPSVRKVGVATDMTEFSSAAIEHAYGLVPPGGEVFLIHVAPKSIYHSHENLALVSRMRELVPAAADPSIVTRTQLLHADKDRPAVLCAAVERLGLDVICVASHGRSGVSRLVMGSFAEDVLRRSTKPVLVVRPPSPSSMGGSMSAQGRILVVDDEVNARTALAELLRDEGYQVETASDGFKALPKLDQFAPDVLLTDLKMPGMNGIELMGKAVERECEPATLVMTAFGAVETAVEAMKAGAQDYLTKPIHMDELLVVLERTLERRRLVRESTDLRRRVAERHQVTSIIGSSPSMQRVFDTVVQVAPSRACVLIRGESGTGKELVAAALHEHSARAKGPFVRLHCAALAESLLESELFGHERGAFTGAVARRDGRFQQAHGGTLFLDEISEISPSVQVKLLRFLQEHEFERVGSNQTIKVDVRIVAATNRDLENEVREGHFREDLYYRLNVVPVELPPLRDRGGDIAILATHFLNRYAQENDKPVTGFTPEALDALSRYAWPGNVRELENLVERAIVLCRKPEISVDDLPVLSDRESRDSDGPPVPGSSMAELEKHAILRTLEHTGGSTSRAAEILGISVRKIQYKLREYTPDAE